MVNGAQTPTVLAREPRLATVDGAVEAMVRRYELLQQALDEGAGAELEDESVRLGQALLGADLAPGIRSMVEVSLSVDLVRRYRRLGPAAAGDLDQAIRLGRTRVRAGDAASWVTDRVNLASALLTSWQDRDRADHLDEVTGLLEPAVTDDGVSAEGRAMMAVNLAAAYSDRYDLARRPADLERAVTTLRIAVAGPDPSVAANAKVNLASTLLTAHDTGIGPPDPLGEAAALIEEAFESADGGEGGPASWWYTAARVRLAQFEHDGNAGHLDRADAALAEALAALAQDSPERGSYLGVAAALAFTRYTREGGRRHLETAISTALQARARDGLSPQDLAILANQACLAVTERFELDGNRDDLDQAISLAREALASPTRLDIEGGLRVNLALALHQHFELTGDRRDLAQGIATIVPALRLRAPSPERAIALNAAGMLYESKALTAQADGDVRTARADLDQAVRYTREALPLTREGSQDSVVYRSNLASRLSSRAELTGSGHDLDEAISNYETALGHAVPDSTASARISYTLACHYAARSARGGHPGDLQRACDLWDDALAADEPFITQFAGQRLGDIAWQIGEWEKCERALALSLEAARVLTARRPRLADRERARFAVQGTAAVAAVAAVRAGSPERAVVHLEQGSTTLLAEAAGWPADAVTIGEIVRAARGLGGPLVYWAATDAAGISLIVSPGGSVTPVPLEVTTAEVSHAIDRLRAAFADNTREPAAQLARWNAAVEETMRWTWQTLVSPVADAIGSAATAGLIPVGRLAALPLATARAQDSAALYERTIPRVLPNARSAGAPAPWPTAPRAVVICQPGDQDQYLPAIESEARQVAACYRQVSQVIAGAAAASGTAPRRLLRQTGVAAPDPALPAAGTADEFVRCLQHVEVAHIACHFRLEFTDPLASVLGFRSGVPLADLLGQTLPAASHLVLSACDSGLAGTRLPDEAIGPARLLLACGARSVLAALWPLDDATAPGFMAEYHRRLASGQEPATALALTQRAVSRAVPLAVWPAFVHVGP
jgi:CHAT domain-containing protein